MRRQKKRQETDESLRRGFFFVKALKSCAKNAIRAPRRRLTFELTHASRGKRRALSIFFSSSLLVIFFEFLTSIFGRYPEWQDRLERDSKSICKSKSGTPALFKKITVEKIKSRKIFLGPLCCGLSFNKKCTLGDIEINI